MTEKKLEGGVKMKVYIYCTKGKPYLHRENDDTFVVEKSEQKPCYYEDYANYYSDLNGKVVASFDLLKKDFVEYFSTRCFPYDKFRTLKCSTEEFLSKSCTTEEEMLSYFKNEIRLKKMPLGYAWHINNLEILKKPLNLENFYACDSWGIQSYKLETPPISWQNAYLYNVTPCVIISIKPKDLCKILNGEKTIIIRKTISRDV